jgi:queuine/archaeosine tRNA-ribosyltransferase
LKFVVALSISPCDLKRQLGLWQPMGRVQSIFGSVLISPLFASPTTINIAKSLKSDYGSEVYFDSGGYYVQQGRLSYQELYGRLLAFYLKNQWADWYVLPDHVPTSLDDQRTVEHKIRDTITVSSLFLEELPPGLRERAIPVIQGHTREQIQRCIESYAAMGARYVGFGSFGTAGVNNSINQLTSRALDNLQWACQLAAQYSLRIHLFGMTSPPIVWLFSQLGAYSFDSLGWNKTANYGNVYLPFVRAHNVSYRDPDQSLYPAEQFEIMKSQTRHDCPFCRDFVQLSTDYHYRRAHNLAVLKETAERCHLNDAAEQVWRYAPAYLRTHIRNHIKKAQ